MVSTPKALPARYAKALAEVTRREEAGSSESVAVKADEHIFYKAVAVVDGSRFFSVFDGTTEYLVGRVSSPPGGCFVCPTLSAVLVHAAKMPVRSALYESPRAVLRVAGWNAHGRAPSWPEGHPPSKDKLLVSHVRPISVLPHAQLMAADAQLAASALARPAPCTLHPALSSGISFCHSGVASMWLPEDEPSASSIIDGFARRFPRLSLLLLRGGGQLSINCGQRAYDPSAWLSFHAFKWPDAPAPLGVRVLRERGEPSDYNLLAALCDVETCLDWMVRDGGPCELVLVPPSSELCQAALMVEVSSG